MEKAIIIGVNNDRPVEEYNEELCELMSLCEACEINVVDTITQNLSSFNPQTYVGKGKLEEIAELVEELKLDVLIFNDELRPLQINNIKEVVNCEIYDRTYVILEIFRRRAHTKEAILQVEIATLKYRLPQLVGMHSNLSRQRGGDAGYAHTRGSGETKLELDKRMIYDRIANAKKELDELTFLRQQQRTKRKKQQMKIVSLVGYTNSGKSSTLNACLKHSVAIKKEVFEKDMLFATLETSTRLIKTSHNLQFLLTDTVGFISKLPHQLIEAFKSTLEEITESDLIVHIVDSANPNFEKQVAVTENVLQEIGVKDIPIIYAFNKTDLHSGYFFVPAKYEPALRISATKGTNIDQLLEMIEESLYQANHLVDFAIPFQDAQKMNLLRESAIILKSDQDENNYLVTAKVSDHILELLKDYQK